MDNDHVVMDDNGVELLNVSATTDDLRDANNDGHQSAGIQSMSSRVKSIEITFWAEVL